VLCGARSGHQQLPPADRQPDPRGFRIVEAYSRIVRLGEGLSQTGRLSEAAMERSMAALKVCAEKIRRRRA
jgi:exopolyphosphatase/guanosine-5'-triphosphate,3'-diphosphate pyrophosphatase